MKVWNTNRKDAVHSETIQQNAKNDLCWTFRCHVTHKLYETNAKLFFALLEQLNVRLNWSQIFCAGADSQIHDTVVVAWLAWLSKPAEKVPAAELDEQNITGGIYWSLILLL